MYFRTHILSALPIARVTGSIYRVYQAYFITPIIINLEIYEVVDFTKVHQVEKWRQGHLGMEWKETYGNLRVST